MHEKIEKLRGLKLLFVEDEKDLLSIISDALTKLQANFFTANNGLEALDILKNNPDIDAIITDINMPLMNGLDMIENIREQNIQIPIIIMSAHTESEYITRASNHGVSEYLLKPFDFIKFIDLITSMEIK
ncbi:response regulator [Poseidonibacter ostreae]|jgi:YesN/AraC family two-component response regulator|uniref:Response regulator n=1 Tax=Poseidonibacter ostreae TaxID=2654171 RepID=A0A6L4WRL5_9BACT|nr:response regulator [Poseidonibacter ostreae]KAB7885066.1 response regulator [Poseidonibacter ostreae]KAB7887873.1 response regulator [Poseidonibacter ostreae]KAB7891142.1 response regulator [Poseidonibacter ostreae]